MGEDCLMRVFEGTFVCEICGKKTTKVWDEFDQADWGNNPLNWPGHQYYGYGDPPYGNWRGEIQFLQGKLIYDYDHEYGDSCARTVNIDCCTDCWNELCAMYDSLLKEDNWYQDFKKTLLHEVKKLKETTCVKNPNSK